MQMSTWASTFTWRTKFNDVVQNDFGIYLSEIRMSLCVFSAFMYASCLFVALCRLWDALIKLYIEWHFKDLTNSELARFMAEILLMIHPCSCGWICNDRNC